MSELGPLEDRGTGAPWYLLVSGSCNISTEVEAARRVQEHNWENLVEVSQDWLGGREKPIRAQVYLQASWHRPALPQLTKEGSELGDKLIPLTVRSVLARVNQRR